MYAIYFHLEVRYMNVRVDLEQKKQSDKENYALTTFIKYCSKNETDL
jgi:hypothetical protein